ncbi:thiopurine S-methyltransferase [Croceicoccus bisphenolivorans]|uniref:thiopurine S-methyltransferase n=1 Tax=Croceicoccus bisphenolivorans TaxID=1783232 RepID=UPI0008366CEA|nr:thiopurine S-methyltransferase [Croceicoccus bisphenolivorans]
MEPEFWHSRWQANEIGFHEGRANDLLVAHLGELEIERGARIFVPLCGKAQDIPWLLAQGYEVVGVELSAIAVGQLFADMGVTPQVTRAGALTRYDAQGITIFAGDMFALEGDLLGPVDAIYDRASLVALPSSMRTAYATKLRELAPDAPRLLITFVYDQAMANGPPFSIPESEVRRLFGNDYRLTQLEDRDVEGGLKGMTPAREAAWLIDVPA